jgi:hypothetical protein
LLWLLSRALTDQSELPFGERPEVTEFARPLVNGAAWVNARWNYDVPLVGPDVDAVSYFQVTNGTAWVRVVTVLTTFLPPRSDHERFLLQQS